MKLFWQLGAAVMFMFAPEWLICMMLFMILVPSFLSACLS